MTKRIQTGRSDEQPLQRIVGRRVSRDGQPSSAEDRAALDQMGRYRTRAPKGVFIYRSAAEMDNDRLRWTVDAMLEKQR